MQWEKEEDSCMNVVSVYGLYASIWDVLGRYDDENLQEIIEETKIETGGGRFGVMRTLSMKNSLKPPLVSQFFTSRFRLGVCFPAVPLFPHSSCFHPLLFLSPQSLYQTTCPCHAARLWLRLLWPGLGSPLTLAAAACVATLLLQPLPSIIYTHTDTLTQMQIHTACATHSIHCPGATADFKLQLAEPEAKLNLKRSSVEVTQTGNNCLSLIYLCMCVSRTSKGTYVCVSALCALLMQLDMLVHWVCRVFKAHPNARRESSTVCSCSHLMCVFLH